MRKRTICIDENKGAEQLHSDCEADHAFVFATSWIVQYLYFLKPKFPASSHLLCLYSSVCVGPDQKPHCWFSLDVAHVFIRGCGASVIKHQTTNRHLTALCQEITH